MLNFYSVYPKRPIATSPTTKIPRKLRTKDIGIKNFIFNFITPIIARPTSSGKGEAMKIAPKKGIRNLKKRKRKISLNLFLLLISSSIFLVIPFRKNLKITISATTAPKLPKKATPQILLESAILARVTVDKANVKIDVKNMPATKLPKNLIPLEAANNPSKVLVLTRR